MNKTDAIKVGNIVLSADGGCAHCATNLVAVLRHEFPEHKDLFWDILKKSLSDTFIMPDTFEEWLIR